VADLARLLLLLLAGAFFVQLMRGTGRAWLSAKFLGTPRAIRVGGGPR
jgi:hypothetical protein